MGQIFPKLLEAFQRDHVILGRGFNELSSCLRVYDATGAWAAVRWLGFSFKKTLAASEQERPAARSQAAPRCA